MYKRSLEQVAVSVVALTLGIISVLVTVSATPKDDYGTFVSGLALQYVVARIILAGILVQLQLELAEAINSKGAVSSSLVSYAAVSMGLTVMVLIALWALQLIAEPMLGILMGATMILGISAMAMNSWLWYRSSVLVPEMALLSLIYLWRNELNLDLLYEIYYIYYFLQGGLALIGIINLHRQIYIDKSKKAAAGDLFGGTIASLSIMARDRLTVAVAGFLYSPTQVADLAYLMTVFKGALSVGGTLNSVKFVQLAGKRPSIIFGVVPLLLENLVLASFAILGYVLLWFYTIYVGNFKYLSALTEFGLAVMIFSVILNFNHSIWYSNQLIRRKIWIYNYSAIAFLVSFATMVSLLHFKSFFDITFFFGVTQVLLAGSAIICRRAFASKNF